MHTSINEEDHQPLARAWALLDGAEYLARQAAQTELDSSRCLLAANSILPARDAVEAISPSPAPRGGPGPPVGGVRLGPPGAGLRLAAGLRLGPPGPALRSELLRPELLRGEPWRPACVMTRPSLFGRLVAQGQP